MEKQAFVSTTGVFTYEQRNRGNLMLYPMLPTNLAEKGKIQA